MHKDTADVLTFSFLLANKYILNHGVLTAKCLINPEHQVTIIHRLANALCTGLYACVNTFLLFTKIDWILCFQILYSKINQNSCLPELFGIRSDHLPDQCSLALLAV